MQSPLTHGVRILHEAGTEEDSLKLIEVGLYKQGFIN